MEWWSKGVMECCRTAKMPGRRPALPEAAVEIACSRAFGGRLEAGFGEKWLCSITRIYTQLHAFTQGSCAVTLRVQTKRKSPRRHRGTERERRLAAKERRERKRGGKWSSGVVGCRPVCWPNAGECGNKADRKWEKVVRVW